MAKKSKRFFLILSGLSALLFLAVIMWVCIVSGARPAYVMPDTSDWQTGDIFFSVGDSWESVAVRSLSGAKYFEVSDSTPSHCGIIVRDDNDGLKLVHASTTAKKIVAETPEEYLTNNGSCCLFARRVCPEPDEVNIRRAVDSLIANNVPFDFEFNHRDSRSLYCTEMVVSVFELVGSTRFSPLRKQNYIYPEDLLNVCCER